MWTEKKENSYSVEEFQLFIEYCRDNKLTISTDELLTFLRLLRVIEKTK